MDVLSEAKRIASEATDLAKQIEEAETATGTGTPTNYSSSVTSCSVDPETGNVDLRITLYPGDAPIEPEPVSTPPGSPVDVPATDVPEQQEPPAEGFQPTPPDPQE